MCYTRIWITLAEPYSFIMWAKKGQKHERNFQKLFLLFRRRDNIVFEDGQFPQSWHLKQTRMKLAIFLCCWRIPLSMQGQNLYIIIGQHLVKLSMTLPVIFLFFLSSDRIKHTTKPSCSVPYKISVYYQSIYKAGIRKGKGKCVTLGLRTMIKK